MLFGLKRPESSIQLLPEGSSFSNLQYSVVRVSEDLTFASICTDKFGIVLSKKDLSKFTPEEVGKLNAAVAAVDSKEVEKKIDELNSKNGSLAGPYTGEISKGLKEIVQARLEAVVNSDVQNLRISGMSFSGTSVLATSEKVKECMRLKEERDEIARKIIDLEEKGKTFKQRSLKKQYDEATKKKDTADDELSVLSWRVLEAVNLEAKYNAILDGEKSYQKHFMVHFSKEDGIYIEEGDPVKETPVED